VGGVSRGKIATAPVENILWDNETDLVILWQAILK